MIEFLISESSSIAIDLEISNSVGYIFFEKS